MPVVASRARSVLILLALGVGCGGKAQDFSAPVAPPSTPEPASESPTNTADTPEPAAPCSDEHNCVTKGSAHEGAERVTEAQAHAKPRENAAPRAAAPRPRDCAEDGVAGGLPQEMEKDGCRKMKAPAAEQDSFADVLPVDGANVSIGSIAVDGLQATDLRCRREGGGGLFGGAMGAISGIAKRKKRLMACGSSPEDVRVRWTTAGGRIKTVEVEASSKKVSGCVKKALKGASAAFGGTCAATFSIGN